MAVDDSYTKVLLHFDGDDESTVFTDESGKTWTAHGDVQITTDDGVFDQCVVFDGTTDYLTTPAHADFNLADGDFTIDFRIKPTSSNRLIWMQKYTSDPSYTPLMILLDGSGNFLLYATGSTSSWNVADGVVIGAASINNWQHIAVAREGTAFRYFLNGNLVATITTSVSLLEADGDVFIGAYHDGTYGMIGYMDELRWSKGIARWTDDFDLPDAAYGSDPGKFNVPASASAETFKDPAAALTSYSPPSITAVDSFVAPDITGNSITLDMYASAAAESFIIPLWTDSDPSIGIPAIAAADTFVAPTWAHVRRVPSIYAHDIFQPPEVLTSQYLISGFSGHDTFQVPSISGVSKHRDRVGTLATGKHITITFENSSLSEGFVLRDLKVKVERKIDNVNGVQLNAIGNHLALEITNETAGDFVLNYLVAQADQFPER